MKTYIVKLLSGDKVEITADEFTQGDLALIFTNKVGPSEGFYSTSVVIAIFRFDAIEYMLVVNPR